MLYRQVNSSTAWRPSSSLPVCASTRIQKLSSSVSRTSGQSPARRASSWETHVLKPTASLGSAAPVSSSPGQGAIGTVRHVGAIISFCKFVLTFCLVSVALLGDTSMWRRPKVDHTRLRQVMIQGVHVDCRQEIRRSSALERAHRTLGRRPPVPAPSVVPAMSSRSPLPARLHRSSRSTRPARSSRSSQPTQPSPSDPTATHALSRIADQLSRLADAEERSALAQERIAASQFRTEHLVRQLGAQLPATSGSAVQVASGSHASSNVEGREFAPARIIRRRGRYIVGESSE